jgi:DNA-binding NtrC family response regulator
MAHSVSIGNTGSSRRHVFSVVCSGSSIAGNSGNSMQTKVLIVEDDNAMAQMCAKLIRRRGHTVVIAASGQDALAMVREARDIDVVITDVQMPKMSGMQLAARLHALNANLPIILMTGYALLLSPSEALEIGAADYILKPFEPETLIGSLERALNSVIRGQTSKSPN